jgi:hypothetical protein
MKCKLINFREKLSDSHECSLGQIPPMVFFFLTFFLVEWITADLTPYFSLFLLPLAIISVDGCIILHNKGVWRKGNKSAYREVVKKIKSWIPFLFLSGFLLIFAKFSPILRIPVYVNLPKVFLYHIILMVGTIILLELQEREFFRSEYNLQATLIVIAGGFTLIAFIWGIKMREEAISKLVMFSYRICLALIIMQIITRAINFTQAIKSHHTMEGETDS